MVMKYCNTCPRLTEDYVFRCEFICTVCLDDVFTNYKLSRIPIVRMK